MSFTRRALMFAAVASLAIAGVSTSQAIAAPIGPDRAIGPDGAASLVKSLGDARTAGLYRDASGVVRVNVTDPAAADAVRAAGATPRLVSRSTRELTALQARLDSGVRGTAWSVDPVSNQVLVQADGSVGAKALAGLQAKVDRSAGAARLIRAKGTFRTLISGGDAIYGGQYRCSLGFNVRSGSTYYFLTAGHCGNIASTWYANSAHTTVLGTRTGSSFPTNDYAIVRFTNSSIAVSGTVGSQDITSSGNAFVGENVRRRGSTTGTHSGVVQRLDVTVHYSSGETVRQMIQTNVCAEGGDSGGPLYDGTKAVGLTSGGSGNCSQGGTTFFQPVVEALNAYNVSVF